MGKTIEGVFPYNSNDLRPSRSPSWDGSQERMLFETILNQRFNFLLVFVGLIVTGGINARTDKVLQCSVFAFGAVVTLFLSMTIWRAHRKLDIIMQTLYTDTTHPAAMINRAAGGFSVRWIIGWGIPMLCTLALTAEAILLLLPMICCARCSR